MAKPATMSQADGAVTRARLKTPKAAAIAGIVFSVLLTIIFWLFRRSVPADPLESGQWLAAGPETAALGLNLIPFAGIAFLWFIGVLRDRLGSMEDRFFATVFLGSALLFLAALFSSAAILGADILIASIIDPNEFVNSVTFKFSRATAYILMNVYAVKIAGVFMISTSTVLICTGIAPRWMAILGYVLAIMLIVGSYFMSWSILVLPIWVLLISAHILIDNLNTAARDQASR